MPPEYVDEELEALRRRKLLELQRRIAEAEQAERARQEAEMRKQAVLRVILTPEARMRLNNLKMVKPELAEQLELQLSQLAQAGRLPVPLTDEQLKAILAQLHSKRREITIRRI